MPNDQINTFILKYVQDKISNKLINFLSILTAMKIGAVLVFVDLYCIKHYWI